MRGPRCCCLRRALLVAGALPVSLVLSYVGPATAHARLDKSFGSGGVAAISLPSPPALASTSVLQMAAYKNGESFVFSGGSLCGCPGVGALFRYTSGGDLDTTFGAGGAYVLPQNGRRNDVAMTVDTLGRPLLAASSGSESTVILRRLTSSGQLDTSFGDDGSATFECRCEYGNLQLMPGPKGMVTVSLSSYTAPWGGSEEVSAYSLTRLRPDGSLDTNFGTDGSTTFYMRADTPYSWATAKGGALYLGGERYAEEGAPYVIRVSARGRLDRRFDAATRRSLRSLESSWVNAVLLRPNGTIDLLGARNHAHRGFDVRLESSGRLNRRFATDGLRALPFPVSSAALGDTGTTFATGHPWTGPYREGSEGAYLKGHHRLLGILPDGRIDPEFGRHGEPIPSSAGHSDLSVVAQVGGKAEVLDDGVEPLCRSGCHPEPTLSRFVDRPPNGGQFEIRERRDSNPRPPA